MERSEIQAFANRTDLPRIALRFIAGYVTTTIHDPRRIPRSRTRNPVNAAIADELFRLALPDAWIVSGCLVQTVWNVKTGRAVDYGIADYDVFYFDPDTSWEAEDAVIRKLRSALEALARRSSRATRHGFISGMAKSTACPTRRCDRRRRVSTGF